MSIKKHLFSRRPTLLAVSLLVVAPVARLAAQNDAGGRLEVRILSDKGQAPLPCRVHLRDSAGKAVMAPALPAWFDHFDCLGQFAVGFRPGKADLTIERGPEYLPIHETLEITAGQVLRKEFRLKRWIDMHARGWYSGELHVHRPIDQMPLVIEAEDLHVAPVLSIWRARNYWRTHPLPPDKLLAVADGGRDADRAEKRWLHVLAAEDERLGGALLFLNLREPIELPDGMKEWPSPTLFAEAARKQNAWIDVEKPFWWDAPTWVALGYGDSIGILNNHTQRSTMLDNEAWGRPRDRQNFPGPHGVGLYSLDIYYRLLNCGFRIPPSAGSASGVLKNPVGYNRMYVRLGDVAPSATYDAWFAALRAGRAFVTNGPMLFVTANGELPGAVLRGEAAKPLAVKLAIEIEAREPIDRVEVIHDGRVAETLRPDAGKAKMPWSVTLRPGRSGWLAVRAVGARPDTLRLAHTAPFYIEVPGTSPVDPPSARYFVDWLTDRIQRLEAVREKDFPDPATFDGVVTPHRRALAEFTRLGATP